MGDCAETDFTKRDDDSDVLHAIERDLRAKYGADYRVMGSEAPASALEILKN